MDENNSLDIENTEPAAPEADGSVQAFNWEAANSADESAVPPSDEVTSEETLCEENSDSAQPEQVAEDTENSPLPCEDTPQEENTEEVTEEEAGEEVITEPTAEENEDSAVIIENISTAPPKKAPKHKGFIITMIIMVVVFLLAFAILSGVLIFGLFENLSDAIHGTNTVKIEITDKGPTKLEDGLASAEVLENAHSSVVVITNEQENATGLGSGFIISKDGYIVTNHHVIEDSKSLTVELYDGRTFDAEIIGSSDMADLAVIKIDADELNNIVIGKSENCYVGERVYAIGCPDGYELAWTTTMGIISHTDRAIKMYDDAGKLEKTMNLLQTDVAVNKGNSGGPLINTRGEVVGIVTLKISNTAGLGFAIPIDSAMKIVQEIITTGSATGNEGLVSAPRAMLGITCVSVSEGEYYVTTDTGIKEITKEQADAIGDYIYASVSGIYVMGIDEKYNAVGKLFEGDIITEVDSHTVRSNLQLSYYLDEYKPDETVTLKVYRNGEYVTVSITLAKEIK